MSDVTVCINHYNWPIKVKKVIESIPSEYPVFVIDSGSTVENYENLSQFIKADNAHHTMLLRYESNGLCKPAEELYKAKNYLMKYVDTKYTIFNDGDFIYTKEGIPQSIEVFENLPDCGIIGHVGVENVPMVFNGGGHIILDEIDINGIRMCKASTIGGCSTLNTTQMWKDIGGWPEQHKAFYQGDGIYAASIYAKGKWGYVPRKMIWGKIIDDEESAGCAHRQEVQPI